MAEATKHDVGKVTEALDVLAPSQPETSVASPHRWAAPAAKLRATTRWVLAVFGVIGTAFLASLPFVGLGELDWPSARAVAALAGAVLLVGGLTVVLRAASEVFIARVATLTDFKRDFEHPRKQASASSTDGHGSVRSPAGRDRGAWLRRIGIDLRQPPYERQLGLSFPEFEVFQGVAVDLEDLLKAWHDARMAKWRTASAAAHAAEADGPEHRIAKLAEDRFKELDDVGTYVVSLAGYRELVQVYRWAQGWIFAGAVTVAIGAFIFFAAVQDPQDEPATTETAGTQTAEMMLMAATSTSGPAGPDPAPSPPCPEVCTPTSTAPPTGTGTPSTTCRSTCSAPCSGCPSTTCCSSSPSVPGRGDNPNSTGSSWVSALASGLGATSLALAAAAAMIWAYLRQSTGLLRQPLFDHVLRPVPPPEDGSTGKA